MEPAALPNVWVVSTSYGAPSQIWIERQVRGFSALNPRVVAWRRDPFADAGERGVSVSWMPTHSRPDHHPRRWLQRLQNLPHGNFLGAVGVDRRTLAELCEETQPDVILANFGHSALRVLPIAEAAGIPLVAHFHGLDLSSSLLTNRWYRWSLLKNLQKFAAIIVVGSHQYRWMLEQGIPEERVHLIPCGAPVHDNELQRSQDGSRFRFIAVSRLVPWKGLDYAIRGFAQAQDSVDELELHIVGDGPDLPRLTALVAELGLEEKVIFHGYCTSQEVDRMLEDADAFVQHSIEMLPGEESAGWVEGFGVSIAEGAAAGLPVIATRTGGIPDHVLHEQTGLLVSPRDADAMAESMIRLARDRGMARTMGAAGRKNIQENYEISGQVAKLEQAILGTLGQNRG